MNCVSLTNVDFKNHTVQYLGDRAFAGCSNLAAVNNLSTVVNKGIRIYEGTKMSSVDDVDKGVRAYFRHCRRNRNRS